MSATAENTVRNGAAISAAALPLKPPTGPSALLDPDSGGLSPATATSYPTVNDR